MLLKSCHLHQTLTQTQCMPSRDRIGIPVNIPDRCLYRYIYISSMAYKTVLQTLETMKLGKNGGG